MVFPRGSRESSKTNEYLSCYIQLVNCDDVLILKRGSACLRFQNFAASRFERNFDFSIDCEDSEYCCTGFHDFLLRKTVIEEYLKADGSLVVECDFQTRGVWYPKITYDSEILFDLYKDASSETADVFFSVGDTTYRAHKCLLSLRCKKLYEIAKDFDINSAPIQICSVKKEIFKSILDFLYSVQPPKMDTEEIATELLVAADLYHCVQLKLYVESVLVEKFLKTENAADLLVLADSQCCALLKEAATNLILENIKFVQTTPGWAKVEESARLQKELFISSSRCTEKLRKQLESGDDYSIDTDRGDPDNLDVSSLRRELENSDLEVDGSREILVNQWKPLRSQKKTHQRDVYWNP